jgi:hypothetical protein
MPQVGLVFPGYTAVSDPVANLNHFVADYPFGFAQIILSIGLIEGAAFPGEFWTGGGEREAGDLGYDPLGYSRVSAHHRFVDLFICVWCVVCVETMSLKSVSFSFSCTVFLLCPFLYVCLCLWVHTVS